MINADALFTSRRVQLVTLATRHAVPAIYTSREFAEVGACHSGLHLRYIYQSISLATLTRSLADSIAGRFRSQRCSAAIEVWQW